MDYYDPSKLTHFLLHPNPVPLYIVHPFILFYIYSDVYQKYVIFYRKHTIALQQDRIIEEGYERLARVCNNKKN